MLNQKFKMKLNIILLIFLVSQINLNGQEISMKNEISLAQKINIESSILGEERDIFIYQPQGLWGMDETLINLPVIYVLDGESQFNHTMTTVDFLSIATNGNDFIPRSIVVGIPNTNRDRDLTPIKDEKFENSGGGPKFLDFITQELIPYIDENYNTSNHRTIIGHSMGALISFEALLKRRNYFDNYIAIDPGFGLANESFLNEVLDTLNNVDLSTENLYFSAANNRPDFITIEDMMLDTSEFIKSIDLPNHKFIEANNADKWKINLTTKYYPNENHYSIPHISTYDGLRELYKFYTFPEITNYYHPKYKHKEDLVNSLKQHYKTISHKLGYEAIPMQGYINSFAFGLSHFDREDMAIDLFKYNIELHPEDPVVYNNLGYYYMINGNIKKAIRTYNQSLQLTSDEWVLKTVERLQKM
jgi:predicted alpha/beta superfamily hydrolase